MNAPDFWGQDGRRSIPARLLTPLAALYAAAGAVRAALARPYRASIPVVCVGSLVAGGAGKTPIALALVRHLLAQGRRPHCLSRGYGGSQAGPVHVDPARHGAAEVGDEPLLLAAAAPCWVARNRPAGLRAAEAAGAEIVVMDDGFQNPTLAKDLSLLAIDGAQGFGNGRVMPAGPLREPIARGLGRADAIVLIGPDRSQIAASLAAHGFERPVLHAQMSFDAETRAWLAGRRILAFAGIGRPAKLYGALAEAGAEIADVASFPDHHPYRATELARLEAAAKQADATLVTTAKDAVRLAPEWRARARIVTATLTWEEPAGLDRLLAAGLARR